MHNNCRLVLSIAILQQHTSKYYSRNHIFGMDCNIARDTFIHKENNIKKEKEMKKISILMSLMLLLAVSLTSCNERIDAGCEGILVNQYGTEKGVDDVVLCTGRVWYNPFTQEVYEYPTYVQTVDYPPFKINAKDGSEFTIDPTISLKIIDGKSPIVFRKYRKELKDVIEVTLYNYVKDAFRIQLNQYTTDQIVSNRAVVEKAIETHLSKALACENFKLEQLTSGLAYPDVIVQSVNAKNKAVQEAMRVENELKVVEAEAKKKMVAAEAEYKANELRTKALTPAILEQMWIDKWDGHLPTYGTVPSLFKDISKR